MQILWYLFLLQFKKAKYTIPLVSVTMVTVGISVLRYLARGIFEAYFFDKLLKFIVGEPTNQEGDNGMITILQGHPEIILYSILIIGFLIIFYLMFREARKEFRNTDPTIVLTNMHKRLMNIKHSRLTRKVKIQQIEDASPVLMDRLGLVDMDKWDSFLKNTKKRLKRGIPKNPKNRKNAVLIISKRGADLKKDLCESKQWELRDADIVCDWLEENHLGVRELRDKDLYWNNSFEKLRPCLVDNHLRKLIQSHIVQSCIYTTTTLIAEYSFKWPNSDFLAILHSVLIGSPLDPIKIEIELSKTISEIDRRIKVLQKEADIIIEQTKKEGGK